MVARPDESRIQIRVSGWYTEFRSRVSAMPAERRKDPCTKVIAESLLHLFHRPRQFLLRTAQRVVMLAKISQADEY